jgi:membrane protease YdiL (CAAX protease family)
MLAAALPVGVTLISMMWQGEATASHTRALAPIALLSFAPAVLIGAWLEETGWSALAAETLLQTQSILPTALVIGVIWALWHLVPLAQVGRSPMWIAWWIVGTLAMRVTLVWLYARSDHHVHAPALFHAVDNFCWQGQMALGTEFDPRIHGILMTGIAVIVITANGRRC